MDRRSVLKLGLGVAASCAAEPLPAQLVIDAHIHLFDTRRPGGVPWPDKTDPIYSPALPDRYADIARSFGVVGAIAVEASPLRSDNDWVLQLIERNPIIVGFVGNLVPGSSAFADDLDRLHANPLFLGIRCGNLWSRDLFADAKNPAFIADLRRLASADLEMDSANPDPKLIAAVLRISQLVPDLRIVIDHLPHAVLPDNGDGMRDYRANLNALGANPRVFVKLSEIPVQLGGRVITDVAYYTQTLDAIWETFGEDRILFGSDWPNSDHLASFAETFGIVSRYVAAKSPTARDKFFRKNSVSAYRWRVREADQQQR